MTFSVAIHRLIAAVLLVLALPVAADPILSVVGYELLSQKRIGPTVFEYAYRIRVHNAGTAADDVEIDLRSAPEGVTVMAPATFIPNLNAGATGIGIVPVIVRHDRTKPFRFDALGWALRGRDATFTGRLSGAANALATSVTKNFIAKPGPRSSLIDAAGNRIELTEIAVVFAANATIAQVNSALDAIGGRISGMGKGQRNMELTIPNPWSFTGLNDRLRTLFNSPGVVSVWPSLTPRIRALPNNFPSPTDSGFFQDSSSGIARSKYIDHHLAIRAHAAWNLAGLLETTALDRRPVMIYRDFFLNDAPDGKIVSPGTRLWTSTVDPADLVDRVDPGETQAHGYNVMSVVSGSFGGLGPDPELREQLITGLFPAELRTRVINLNTMPSKVADRRLIDLVASYTTDYSPSWRRNVIVNTSTGICPDDVPCPRVNREQAWFAASTYINDVRNRLLDADQLPSFLHVYAVGNNSGDFAYYDRYGAADINVKLDLVNDGVGGVIHDGLGLKLTSPVVKPGVIYTSYLDLPPLSLTPETDASGALVLLNKLPNMLGVEARVKIDTHSFTFPGDVILGVPASTRQIAPFVGCPADYSAKRGSIAGIGEAWMLDGAAGPAISSKGTSYAAPQVAAVAAWVWSLAPQLKVTDVRRLIDVTAGVSPVGGCNDADYAKTVDVYAAALATDNPYAPGSPLHKDLGSTAVAPARAWLLDVASVDTVTGKAIAKPDGKFTQADIMLFLQEFEKRKGVQTPDYSRYDLNGNGVTGEPAVRQDTRDYSRFDLDGNLNWASAVKVVEGVSRNFREDITSDLQVLIYYAYSPLYTGNEYERTMLLLPYMHVMGTGASAFLDRLDIGVPSPRSTTFNIGAIQQLGEKFLSQCSAERGAPLYSSVVSAQRLARAADSKLYFWRPVAQFGRLQEKPSNTVNCSSFVAALPGTGLMWVNSAARNVDAATKKDEEYQTRFFLGEPDLAAKPEAEFKPTERRLATQTLTYGIVAEPGGNFIPVFNSPAYMTSRPQFVPAP